jgi:hypothetical protein
MTTPANESSSDPDATISGFDLLFEAAALALAAFLVIGKKGGLP